MTGFEHATAALMIYSGMVEEGVECIHNVRARYDGEKRSPWDEAECGHHYARAMASWTSFVAISGFQFDAAKASIIGDSAHRPQNFQLFLVDRNGWGTFAYRPTAGGGTRFTIQVLAGTLPCRSCEISGPGSSASVRNNGNAVTHSIDKKNGMSVFHFESPCK